MDRTSMAIMVSIKLKPRYGARLWRNGNVSIVGYRNRFCIPVVRKREIESPRGRRDGAIRLKLQRCVLVQRNARTGNRYGGAHVGIRGGAWWQILDLIRVC